MSEIKSIQRESAIKKYLDQHGAPEDFKLSPTEEKQLQSFIKDKKELDAINNTDEKYQLESATNLKLHDWLGAKDLTFTPSDLKDFDENGIGVPDYQRALAKRRRAKAAEQAGLL